MRYRRAGLAKHGTLSLKSFYVALASQVHGKGGFISHATYFNYPTLGGSHRLVAESRNCTTEKGCLGVQVRFLPARGRKLSLAWPGMCAVLG